MPPKAPLCPLRSLLPQRFRSPGFRHRRRGLSVSEPHTSVLRQPHPVVSAVLLYVASDICSWGMCQGCVIFPRCAVFQHMDVPKFTYPSSMAGHLGCFWLGVITNKAAANVLVTSSGGDKPSFLLATSPRVGVWVLGETFISR